MAKTITHSENNNALWGSEDHLQASQDKSFAQMVFELLSEREPSDSEAKIFELILNLSIDHGSDTPSAVKVIEVAHRGKVISESVAAGILEINDSHGGAIEPAMRMLRRIKNNELAIMDLVKNAINDDGRLPGYGHRIYKDQDPRAQLILKKLKENGLQEYKNIALEIEKELETQKGKKLPLNIDGAIAVALCEFGWNPRLGKAVFIIARTPGLCGQYLNCVTA